MTTEGKGLNRYDNALVVFEKEKMFFNKFNFSYYKTLYRSKLYIQFVYFGKEGCLMSRDLYQYQYLVVNFGPDRNLELGCHIQKFGFSKEKDYNLPDGSKVSVFKRYKSPALLR